MKRSSLSETDLKSMDASNHDTDEWLRVDDSDIPLFLESRIEVVSTLATDAVNLAAHHRAEFLSVFLMMISPSVVMVFCLFFLRSIIAAMFGYHVISCISGPALYISFRFGSSQLLKISSQCISKELKIQLLAGFVYFAIIAIGGVCMYWAIGHTIIPNKLDIVEELGLSTDPLVREGRETGKQGVSQEEGEREGGREGARNGTREGGREGGGERILRMFIR